MRSGRGRSAHPLARPRVPPRGERLDEPVPRLEGCRPALLGCATRPSGRRSSAMARRRPDEEGRRARSSLVHVVRHLLQCRLMNRINGLYGKRGASRCRARIPIDPPPGRAGRRRAARQHQQASMRLPPPRPAARRAGLRSPRRPRPAGAPSGRRRQRQVFRCPAMRRSNRRMARPRSRRTSRARGWYGTASRCPKPILPSLQR